ncbi:MAG: hypothetical protein CVU91_10215 [Firmicutes bacterium HGW-Firmicutes-16]|nr:MAG: hypothetical protein CVU91_10215 [Firmicutes bacterium HGW-Firmicutes-16]
METSSYKERPDTEPEAAEEPAKKKGSAKKYVLSGAFLAVLMAVTFYIIFRDTSIDEVWSLLKTVRLPFVYAGMLSILAYISVQAFIIGMAAACIHIKLKPWEMLQYSFAGFFYSGVTPSSTGGQPMQVYHMCRDRLSASKTTLVMFVTNITYQFAVVLIGVIAFCFKLNYIASIHGGIIAVFIIGLSINLGMLLFLAGVLFSENTLKKALRGIVSFLCRIRIIKKPEKALRIINKYLEEFEEGVKLIKANRGRFLITLLASILQFLFYHAVPYFVYKAFGLTGYTFIDFLSISAFLYVAVSMFPLPGAVGAAESGFVLLFGPLFGKMILPAMLLSRFISYYTMLLLSGVISAFAQLRKPYNLTKEHKLKVK